MFDLEFIQLLERTAANKEAGPGLRYLASALVLMILASLWHADAKIMFALWQANAEICGRSRDLKKRGRPITTWAAPLAGLKSAGEWAHPIIRSLEKFPPPPNGHRSLLFVISNDWVIDPSRFAPYDDSMRAFRNLRHKMGVESPGWTLHSPRNWFPSCDGQLGWTLPERRKIGRRGVKTYMPDKYDRAVCTAELRLRGTILQKIATEAWVPTAAFEVPAPEQRPAPAGPTVVESEMPSQVSQVPSTPGSPDSDPESTSSLAPEERIEVDITDLYSTESFY